MSLGTSVWFISSNGKSSSTLNYWSYTCDWSSFIPLNFLALPLVPSDRGSDSITRALFSLRFLELEGQAKMIASLICHLTLPN